SNEILDEDNLGAPVFIFNPIRPQDAQQLSTELRLSSNLSGDVNFQTGIYYVQSEYEITQSVHVFGPAETTPPSPDGDAGQEINAWAVFGEVYWDITEDARLTVGGRYTRETKEVFIFQRVSGDSSGLLPGIWGCGNLSSTEQALADAAAAAHIAAAPTPDIAAERAAALTCNDADGKDSWTEFTPRVSLDYQFNENVMGYVSWSRGFRSGGWNGRATTPTSIGPYDPETVDSYEIGIRSTLFNNKLTLNATAFRADYEDKHESTIFAFGQATETIVENAAQATIDGFELEMRYVPISNLQIRASVGWTEGEYDEYLGVNRLTGMREDISDVFEFGFAPEWNYNIGIDYLYPMGDLGTLIFAANYNWADETTGNFGQPDPSGFGRNEFDDRGEADFAVTWDNRWLTVAAFVKDAFHSDNFLATSVDVGVFWFGAVSPGRTWAIELTKTFE
ncbi:MAG: TonB-dependent receptor, partial [Pseudomonadota bacterium]